MIKLPDELVSSKNDNNKAVSGKNNFESKIVGLCVGGSNNKPPHY